jgi:peptide/nickel transport system substrate-binding protein
MQRGKGAIARRLPGLVYAIGAVCVLAACSTSGGVGAPAPAAGGSLAIRIITDWGPLDPYQPGPSNAGTAQLQLMVYDRLLAIGPSGKLVPYVATSWKVSPTSIVFTVHKDVVCADGTPLPPTAMAKSFQRMVNPTTKNPNLGAFGPGPFTVSADDSAGTLTFTMGTPYNIALTGFANFYAGIICPAGLANPTSLVNTPSGSGPFVIESAIHGDSVSLKVHSRWDWGPNGSNEKAPGFPGHVTLKVVQNETTASNLLLSGGLDVAAISGPDVARLGADSHFKELSAPNFLLAELLMNERPGHPTNDDVVRQAVMMSIDPKAYQTTLYNGQGKLSPSLLSKDSECYATDAAKLALPFDPAKAKQLLLANGYSADSNGMVTKDGKPLTLVLAAFTGGAPGELFQSELAQAGITLTLKTTDNLTYATNLINGAFDLAAVTSPSPFSTPGPVINLIYSGAIPPAGRNYAAITDPTINNDVNQALATVGAESCKHWVDYQLDMLKGHHVLPLSTLNLNWFTRKGQSPALASFGLQIEPYSLRTA